MILTIGNKELTEDYPFETSAITGVRPLEEYGFSSADYGGNAKCVATLKNSDYILIVDKNMKTIDVAIDINKLESVNFKYLRDLARRKQIKFDMKDIKEEVIEKIRKTLN